MAVYNRVKRDDPPSTLVATFLSSNTVQSAAAVRVLYVQQIGVCSACLSVIHLRLMSVRACVSSDDHVPAVLCPEHSKGVFLVQGSESFNTHMVCVCVIPGNIQA